MRLGLSSSLTHQTPEEWAERLSALGCRAVNFPVDYTGEPSLLDRYAKAAQEHDLLIAEVGIVIYLSTRLTRISSATANLLFYVFAAINGLALAPIFLVYTMTSIAKTFFICAGTFGAMSVYGYFTTKDLTSWGNFLMYALMGLIIASLVNIFTKSTQLDWIISIAGVLIFIGLTAWDTQKIKRMALTTPPAYISHLATIGALSLYLDFINLFLYLLRFFGSQRD